MNFDVTDEGGDEIMFLLTLATLVMFKSMQNPIEWANALTFSGKDERTPGERS